MQFLKEIFNSMARTIGRILVYALLGFILYLLANKYVNAESYYVTIENNNGNVVSQSLTTNDFPYSHTSSAYGTTCTSPTNCQELPHEQLRFTLLQNLSKNYMYDFQGQIVVTYRILGNYVGFPTNDIQCYFRGTTETIPCGARISTDLTSDFNDYGLKFIVTIDYNITNVSPSIDRSGIQIFIPKPDLGWSGNNYLVVEKFDISLPTYRQNTKDNTDVLTGNANSNAQNIISSQESIGGNIIQNQNENTEEIVNAIENNNVICNDINISNSDFKNVGYLKSDGTLGESNNYKTTDFIQLSENSYSLIKNFSYSYNNYYCLYDYYKTLIECVAYNGASNDITINNTNASFIRISLYSAVNSNTISFTGKYCYNILEKNGQNIDDIKNSLIDTSIPNNLNLPNVNFSNPISSLFLLPITFVQSLSDTCTSYSIPFLGSSFNFPCINIGNYLGSTLWGIIDLFITFGMIYSVARLFRKVYLSFTSLNDQVVNEFYGTGGTDD